MKARPGAGDASTGGSPYTFLASRVSVPAYRIYADQAPAPPRSPYPSDRRCVSRSESQLKIDDRAFPLRRPGSWSRRRLGLNLDLAQAGVRDLAGAFDWATGRRAPTSSARRQTPNASSTRMQRSGKCRLRALDQSRNEAMPLGCQLHLSANVADIRNCHCDQTHAVISKPTAAFRRDRTATLQESRTKLAAPSHGNESLALTGRVRIHPKPGHTTRRRHYRIAMVQNGTANFR